MFGEGAQTITEVLNNKQKQVANIAGDRQNTTPMASMVSAESKESAVNFQESLSIRIRSCLAPGSEINLILQILIGALRSLGDLDLDNFPKKIRFNWPSAMFPGMASSKNGAFSLEKYSLGGLSTQIERSCVHMALLWNQQFFGSPRAQFVPRRQAHGDRQSRGPLGYT